MKKLTLAVMLVFGLMLGNPTGAQACPKCSQDSGKNACKIAKLKKEAVLLLTHKEHLALTDEQTNKIKDVKHQAMKDIIQQNANIDVIMIDVQSAMWKEKIDLEQVNKLIDSKYGAKVKIAKAYVKAVSDIQSVLNDEQRKKVQEIKTSVALSGNCPVKGCASCRGASDGSICPITGKPIGPKGQGYQAKGSTK